jgi:acetoin utilization deacetylase AcuC-like enzyme
VKTGLITSDTYRNHNTGEGHPEKIDRVTAVIDNFKKLDNKNLIWKKPTSFDQDLLIKTHSLNYINQVQKSFPQNGFNFLDGDTGCFTRVVKMPLKMQLVQYLLQ